jgi:hypothetical protein
VVPQPCYQSNCHRSVAAAVNQGPPFPRKYFADGAQLKFQQAGDTYRRLPAELLEMISVNALRRCSSKTGVTKR